MQDTPQIPLLDPAQVELRLDSRGWLEGSIEGREQKDVRARAVFPYTLPGEYIELRCDGGDLIGFIRRIEELDPLVRKAVRESMRFQHFVPLIRRVLSVKGHHHMYTWRVVTDRGEVEFHIRGRRQNLEEIGGEEHIITDTDGNRYRIPRVPDLDARSLLQLQKVL